jgi:hypothetical protein
MTIEEQIQQLLDADRRIQQRHEALAQTVELLAAMQRENEKRFDQITRNFEIVHDSIKGLETVALAHEQRLDDLDGGQQ